MSCETKKNLQKEYAKDVARRFFERASTTPHSEDNQQQENETQRFFQEI
jgi:hypothetical protein